MPIPPIGRETGYLPVGDYEATLEEIEAVFGSANIRRREIMEALRDIVRDLRALGVETIWVNGSFTTDKPRPGDVDVIYVPPVGADLSSWGPLAPVAHEALKDLRRVDLWPHPSLQPDPKNPKRMITLKQLFETDLEDVPKGHILVKED